jgi:hypothetical protein
MNMEFSVTRPRNIHMYQPPHPTEYIPYRFHVQVRKVSQAGSQYEEEYSLINIGFLLAYSSS